MLGILLDIWHHIVSLKPAFISKKPHFNFITMHYFWIFGIAILGSICLYPNGGLHYIDALFFASGGATQSGLNTVDVNRLNTWQQVVLFILPVLTNPISINTFVVFMRLYWFEKRFQKIAMEAKKQRRSRSKSLTKSKTDERDIGNEEMGVNGRNIVVMHETTRPNSITDNKSTSEDMLEYVRKEQSSTQKEADSSRGSRDVERGRSNFAEERRETDEGPHHAQIKFADQVKRSNGLADEALRIPGHRNTDEHIAFLQRQRLPDDNSVLRIPGPRDADAGVPPEAVPESENLDHTLSQRVSTFDSDQDMENIKARDMADHADDGARRNITIEEPSRSPVPERLAENALAAAQVLTVFRARKPRIFHGDEQFHGEDTHLRRPHSRIGTFSSVRTALSKEKEDMTPYLSWEPTVGRNSQFVNLTEAQREELGGIEYRSLKSLALVLVLYFVGFSLLGFVSLTPWIMKSHTYGSIVEADGQGRVWWGIFTANSAFTDLGFTLTPDSMISFQTAVWPLLIMSFLIIIGNTGFPIMLRIVIWVTAQLVPKSSGIWEELKFLLDHPRRCFTLLFPSKATWWLFWILVVLNGLDLIFFIVLDLGNTIVTQLPVNIRVLDGWFQAASTRTAGFGVVNLAELHPAIQVSYLVMMYISVLPIAISVRRTNVYEEKSLGIYGSPNEENEDEGEPSYVGAHLRRQLSFDLWYIFLGLFIITIAEGDRLQAADPAFTMFTVLFEIVSAYGTVGLSLGYTGINASLSAEFRTVSKLVIIAMQIRGRHRGLPYELDRAILLPSENMQKKEAQDDIAWVRRRSSFAGANEPPQVGISTGAVRTDPNATASKTTKRKGRPKQNFLASLLHPGPTIPNSHRDAVNGDFKFDRRGINTVQDGKEEAPSRNERSWSPKSEAGILEHESEPRAMNPGTRSKTG